MCCGDDGGAEMFCPACLPIVERTAEPRKAIAYHRTCTPSGCYVVAPDTVGVLNDLLEEQADGDSQQDANG